MKKPLHKIQVSQFVKAKREKVFQAWTNPELIKKWSCPEGLKIGAVEADIKVGGRYRTEMRGDEGLFTAIGVYQQIIPNEKIVYTHGWEGPDYTETLVTVEFKEKDGGTEVILTHDRLKSEESAKGHEEGWISTLKNLSRNLFL